MLQRPVSATTSFLSGVWGLLSAEGVSPETPPQSVKELWPATPDHCELHLPLFELKTGPPQTAGLGRPEPLLRVVVLGPPHEGSRQLQDPPAASAGAYVQDAN